MRSTRRYLCFAILSLIGILLPVFLGACEPTTPPPSPEPAPPPTPEAPPPAPTPTLPPSTQELKVHFIDIGQGDSILIDFGDTEMLIDGGDKSPGVVAYLADYVDGALEAVVATHPHADHIGGLIAVLSTFEVEEIWHNGDSSGRCRC